MSDDPKVDALAQTVIRGADIAVTQNRVPREIVTEAFYLAGVAMLVAGVGIEAAAATLRDAADRLENSENVSQRVVN